MKKLFLFAFAVFAMTLVACSGGKGGADTPEDAAKQFTEAILNADVDQAVNVCLITTKTKEEVKAQVKEVVEMYKAMKELGKFEFKVGSAKIDGDKAEVEVTIIANGNENMEPMPAVKVDGRWYVDSEM